MGKHEKLLLKILSGTSDANIHFEDLCNLLKNLGFEERIRGSHHIFRKEGIVEKINRGITLTAVNGYYPQYLVFECFIKHHISIQPQSR